MDNMILKNQLISELTELEIEIGRLNLELFNMENKHGSIVALTSLEHERRGVLIRSKDELTDKLFLLNSDNGTMQ